jgi:hypothetical protein
VAWTVLNDAEMMKRLFQRAKQLVDGSVDGFDAEFYRHYYKDLAALKGASALQAHYRRRGIKEGRFKSLPELRKYLESKHGHLPDDFDHEVYREINKDIAKEFTYDWEFELHYLEFGRAEGRRYKNNLKAVSKYNARGLRRCIYVYRGDGIGTRLLTVIYAKIFADLFGFELKFIWTQIGSPFYDALFQPENIAEIFSGSHIFDDGNESSGEFVTSPVPDPSVEVLRLDHEGERLAHMDRERFAEVVEAYDVIFYAQPYALLMFMTREVDIASEVRRIWKQISWNPRILDFVEETCSSKGVDGAIAVHIRRGDLVKMLIEADVEYLASRGMAMIFQRFTALKTIIEAIDEIRTDETLVVCSDDSRVAETLSRRYGADSVYSSYAATELTDDQRSVVDIMLLSRAKILLSPQMSFFSKCAAEVGDCKHLPFQPDLAAAVEELLEIADRITDARAAQVKALIYTSAAELSSDQAMRAHFLDRARLLEANPLFGAASRPA